ncbi:hypothetical protein K3G39_20475, partial [Pontibacter sp. HSC-14F20]|uniref:hypothetical protein n=1 Tax=Pontibacter sp. HSC-14F20 TaxID=2864136 RepID=UPI001C72C5E0
SHANCAEEAATKTAPPATPDPSHFNDWLDGSFAPRGAGSIVSICEDLWMSVSTVTPSSIAIVVPSYDTTKQQDDQAKTKDTDPTYKPPPPAPLPPGQGTRIDQLA